MYLLTKNFLSCFPLIDRWFGEERRESVSIFTFLAALSSIGVVMGVVLFLLLDSFPIFNQIGIVFFTDADWHPPSGAYGALSMIYGSIVVTFIAILFSAPFAIVSAIFVSEILTPQLRFYAKGCMELLAGIPSIVYGLLGLEIVNRFVKLSFGLGDGSTILSAAIVLAIMVLPTVMTISEDALHNVGREYRYASQGLGLTRRETIFSTTLPMAAPGIMSSILLGISNAIGETMAVMLVIGSIDRLPEPLHNVLAPATTITTKLGRDAAESLSSGLHWNAMSALGLTLFVVVAIIMFLSRTVTTVYKK